MCDGRPHSVHTVDTPMRRSVKQRGKTAMTLPAVYARHLRRTTLRLR